MKQDVVFGFELTIKPITRTLCTVEDRDNYLHRSPPILDLEINIQNADEAISAIRRYFEIWDKEVTRKGLPIHAGTDKYSELRFWRAQCLLVEFALRENDMINHFDEFDDETLIEALKRMPSYHQDNYFPDRLYELAIDILYPGLKRRREAKKEED